MNEIFIKAPYCYNYLVDQISIGLLVYSHIPTAIIAVIFGIFLYYKTRNLSSITLLIVSISFALWSLLDLKSWFAFMGISSTMFTWSLQDMIGLVFFFFSYYFLYTFIKGKDLPIWQKVLGIAALLPSVWITISHLNLTGFDLVTCEAWESEIIGNYVTYTQFAFVTAVALFTIIEFTREKSALLKRKIWLAGVGVMLFLGSFFLTGYLAVLINKFGLYEYGYNFEIYGLFGMPIFLVFLGYLIVKYNAFDLKIFTAQALVVTLITLVAAQFAFIHDITSILLNTLTFVLVSWAGISLSRNVKKEIELRQKNEALAKNLQVANEGQATLIHFINHQIKGYLSKGRSIFAELESEEEYGPLNDDAKAMLKTGEDSLKEGVDFVQDILKASDIEKGTMAYNMESLDFKKVVSEMIEDQRKGAIDKGLEYNFEIADSDYEMRGDINQLKEAVRNLINNSIAYTQKGSININLSKNNNKILFTVKDTGVGLSDEVKPKLFTKGGRDKESQKINVNSTGFGLSIVKGIVDAHHGRVWADSEGPGKGSTFSMELPVA